MEKLKTNIEKYREGKGFLRDLIDNDTLVILSVLAIAMLEPNVREIAIGGLLGVIGMKVKEKTK